VAVAGCHCGSEIWKEAAELRESNAGRRKGKRMENEKERAAIWEGKSFPFCFVPLSSLLSPGCQFSNLRPAFRLEESLSGSPRWREQGEKKERWKWTREQESGVAEYQWTSFIKRKT
jgi:hypothetical protein